MIKAVVRVFTLVTYVDEEGDELNRRLRVVIDLPAVPRKGDIVMLPTPYGYGIQEFLVEHISFVGPLVVLSGKTQNHYMDQEIHDDLLTIGYTLNDPAILTEAMESLHRYGPISHSSSHGAR